MGSWKDEPLWEDNRPKWKKIEIKIYRWLPVWLSIRVAGVMQAYGRPIKFRIKKS